MLKKIHRIEYESLPHICFSFGMIDHYEEVCPTILNGGKCFGDGKDFLGAQSHIHNLRVKKVQERVENEKFGDWMVVERCQRR